MFQHRWTLPWHGSAHTRDTRTHKAGTGGPSKFQEHMSYSDRASIDWKIPTKPSILPNFNMTTYILWKNLKQHQQYIYDISIPITITSQTKTCLMPVSLVNNRCLNLILKLKNLNLEMVHFYNPSTWEIDWEFKSVSVT